MLGGCQPLQDLLDPAEIEAQLRADPGRGGKVGQLVGIAVSHHAIRLTQQMAVEPDPRCVRDFDAGRRWIAELTLERRRGSSVVSSWTETRTLDRTADAVAMRLSATFRTEIDGHGQRDFEWRVTPEATYIATAGRDGDLWLRRDSEEQEASRIMDLADGMLQALLDSVDGWQYAGSSWTSGTTALRCSRHNEGQSFVDRFVAGAKIREAAFHVEQGAGRTLEAAWTLADGSVVRAQYVDRFTPFEGTIEAPPVDRIVPIAPERSLSRAEELLSELATAGLAEVASPSAPTVPPAPKPRDP